MTTRRPLVYIVDDQVANVRLLESILRIGDVADSRGFGDAREALAALGDDAPDLILLDLQMPHLDGFGFMAALSERAKEDDFLPVLVITADIDRDIRRRALGAGAHDFLTKPFGVDEVVARCENLLRTRRLHLALSERNQGLRGELDEQISTLEQERRERAAIVSSLRAHRAARDDGRDRPTDLLGARPGRQCRCGRNRPGASIRRSGSARCGRNDERRGTSTTGHP